MPQPHITVPLGTKTYGELLKQVSIPPLISSSKVSVVGVGKVGAAIAFSLVSSGVCSEMAMVDLNKDVVTGERSDLVDGISFLGRRCNILADSSFAVTKVGFTGIAFSRQARSETSCF